MNKETKETRTLGQILSQIREAAGLSSLKLSQLSGISEDFIKEIETDNFSRVSSLPYLKGVLKKYSRFCQAEYLSLLELAKEQISFRVSGKDDLLPPNRFRNNRFSFRLEFHPLLIIFFIFLSYLIYEIAFLALPPKIILDSFAETSSSTNYLFSGKVWGKIKELTVNNERVFLGKGGYFEKQVYLSAEINLIEFKAKNYFGQETRLSKMVIYNPAVGY
jgi:cytoskeletal protein RodZ